MVKKPRCTQPEMAVGMHVDCPASLFGVAWAKKEHGKAWKSVYIAGKVESFVPKGSSTSRGPSKHDIWNLKFPDDSRLYPQKWDGLRQWLSEDDLGRITSKPTKPRKECLESLSLIA